MGNWLNTYQKVTSQTGKPVTLFIDNAPWRNNPWIEIQGTGRRYRNNGKGGWEIQQASQSSGTWDPVNIVDEEYWTNYVNDIDKKRKETPAQNIFQKVFGIEGKTPEKACGGKVEKGENGIKTNRPTDISNITDDQVANLMYDRSMLGGENTKLELGTNHAYPDIWLYGDSTSTVDGSKWKVKYHSMPGGIFTTDPAVFSRSAREVDDNGNFTGKKEYRSFNYFYPEPEKPNSNSDAHNMAAKNGGTYTYSGNKENYQENKFYTDFYKKYLQNQKSGGKLYNEDLITAIKACGGKIKKKK